ncbi:hypothetical protein [Polluticaenibacter yanchengensis]|uniref:ATP synthase subunit I n=1 Tax=Polluticaenibacter yanchengensis TaxID=3014562 RepID=A0ABT4UM23_9BACT|nr:hypothetical protein [Chitinophagaceae bacterium LY-5]
MFSSKKELLPLHLVFIVFTAIIFILRGKLEDINVNVGLLIGGNVILYAVTLVSILMYSKKIDPKRPGAAVSGVYGGFMLKFAVIGIAAFLYMLTAKTINKSGLIGCAVLYLVYHILGTYLSLQLNKKKEI